MQTCLCVVSAQKFTGEVSNLGDAASSGQPNTANRPDANTEVERMIRENPRVAIDKVVGKMKVESWLGAAHHSRSAELPKSLR